MSGEAFQPAPAAEVLLLLKRMCDGVATPEERDALELQLHTTEEARQLALDYLSLHADLQWYYRGTAPEPLPDVDHEEATIAAVEAHSLPAANALPPPATAIPNADSAHRPPMVLKLLHVANLALKTPLLWSILLVGAFFYGAFILISWNLRPAIIAEGGPAPQAVGQLGETTGVRWSADSRHPANSKQVQSDQLLKIDSGIVELRLDSGAVLYVEGPAQWTVRGPNEVQLDLGALMAKVPKKASGFAVNTPTARIVDLGTEFRSTVHDTTGTIVEVLQGCVRVVPQPGQSETQSVPAFLLMQGEHASITPRTSGSLAVVKKSSASSAPQQPTQPATGSGQKLANRSAEAILALKPVFYFSMDRSDGYALTDRAQGRFEGRLSRTPDTGDAWEAGPFGDALRLRGNQTSDRMLIVPLRPEVDGKLTDFSNGQQPARPFSISLWARCEFNQDVGTLISKGRAHHEQFLFDVCRGSFRFAVIAPEPAKKFVASEVYSKVRFDGTWQHGVAVFDPEARQLRLHVNGRLDSTVEAAITQLNLDDESLYVGGRPDHDGGEQRLTLDGAVDELAIFDRALTAEEVRRLFTLDSGGRQ